MFENLTDKFTSVFRNLKGLGRISEKNIEDAVREVKLALLEADVNYKVVKHFVDDVKVKALGKDVLNSVMPDQQFIKIVNDELTALMQSSNNELAKATVPPTVIMLVGLQGAGKTTIAGKLAVYLAKNNKTSMLAACDVYRPAAVHQLRILSEKCNAQFYGDENFKDPIKIAEDAFDLAKKKNLDYVILDTAGRLEIDENLMNELKEIKFAVKPNEVLYVADAMMGQISVEVAQKFNEVVGVDSIVISKLDGDARGGVALSVKSVIGCPVKFVGVGEKLTDFEPFYADRMASRILGMGDVVGLVEKFQEEFSLESTEKLEKKIKKTGIDLNDFLDQIKQIKKMGSVTDLISMIPGASKLKNLSIDEKQIQRVEAVINSMTKKERSNPAIINGSRRKRIAQGSGARINDVNNLLKQFDMMKKMMKSFTGKKSFPGFNFAGNKFRSML